MIGIGLDVTLGKPYSFIGVGGTFMMSLLTSRMVGCCVMNSYYLKRSMMKK